MRTWTFQLKRQVKVLGEDKAPWYVGYYDPDGNRKCRSCGPGITGKKAADKLAEKLGEQLNDGSYKSTSKLTWTAFVEEYTQRIADGMKPQTKRLTLDALAHFERLMKPARVRAIKTQTIDDYIALRRAEPGKKQGETMRPASINKELRHIRAVLNIAHEWKYLLEVPKFRMMKEPGKLVRFVSPEHFAALYAACDTARRPTGLPSINPADWWRGLLCFGYMTGWRISELLAVRRADVDLEAGLAVTRAEDNKGERDEQIKLHPVVVAHLKKLPAFDGRMFPWNHPDKTLYLEFQAIQEAAGIKLKCGSRHEHTDSCSYYGFHDLRRAFATQNAPRLTGDALQKLMRHKSYLTTRVYINMASQLDEAVDKLHVPDVLRMAGMSG